MKLLVTGGAGYIGSHMAYSLRDRALPFVVLDNLSTGNRRLLPPETPLIVGDVGDEALLDRVLSEHAIDFVIHFAGSIKVEESVANPLLYYENNTAFTRTLLSACVRHCVKGFIFSSTAAVYGNVGAQRIAEDTPSDPVSPYGRSKLMSEWIIEDVARAHRLRYVILRYFNVAGADPHGRSGQIVRDATHLIKVALEVATGARERILIYGDDYPTPDGTCVRDFIHVSDLAAAHVSAVDYLNQGGASQILNCGYGRGTSVRQVLTELERLIGRPVPSTIGPRRPGDVETVIADPARIRRVLDWRPQHEALSVILSTALEWERKLLAESPV
jgi:UDP-glucose 4-epimerase